MTKTIIIAAIIACTSSTAMAGQCDRLTGQRQANCLDGEAQAARYAREARNYERLARVRDGLCVADRAAPRVASRVAGPLGGAVYRGTRAAGNAVSGGASSCRR